MPFGPSRSTGGGGGGGGLSQSQVDGRIVAIVSAWARGIGSIPINLIPDAIMRDAEFTKAAVLGLLELSASELNDLVTGATISNGVITLTQSDGTSIQLTLPEQAGGTADGVVTGGSFSSDGQTLTLSRSVGADVTVSVPAILRQMGATSGQTAAQVTAAINAALDALIGDDTDAIHASSAAPVTQDFTLTRGTEDVAGELTQTFQDVVAEHTISDDLRNEIHGGASADLTIEGVTSASFHGFEPEIELVFGFSSDTAEEVTTTHAVEVNAPFSVTAPIPAAVIANSDDGDDFYITLDIRVKTRGGPPGQVAASGRITIFEITLHVVGSHEAEFETLIDERIASETAARTQADASLQTQIATLRAGALSDTQRRILAQFHLFQQAVRDPIALAVRSGTTLPTGGAETPGSPPYSDPKVESFTPVGTTVQIRTEPLTPDEETAIVLRQNDASGVPQDYSLRGKGRGSADNVFYYEITFPNLNPISFFHIRDEDTLQVLADVQTLIGQMADVQDVLTPDARALLADVDDTHTQTSAVARTSLLSDLTLTRLALSGESAPFSSPALSGGEHIIAVSRARPQTQIATTAEETLVEAYLNDATRIPLVRMTRGANGYAGLTVPSYVPAQPAHSASTRVNLFNLNQGRTADSYDLALSENGRGLIERQDFLVPATLAANTNVTVPVSIEGNEDGNRISRVFTVAVGGAATTAAQTHTFQVGTLNLFDVSVQYIVEQSGRKVLRLDARPSAGVGLIPVRWVMHFGAHYTSAANVAAVPERIDRVFIFGGFQSTVIGTAMAVKVESGNIVLVLEGSTSSFHTGGEFNTGLQASDYGLQAGGTGVLRFSGAYNEIIRVTAGDPDSDDMEVLRGQVDPRAFGIGLFTNVASDDAVFAFDRAIKAPKFLNAQNQELGTGGGTSSASTQKWTEILAAPASGNAHGGTTTILAATLDRPNRAELMLHAVINNNAAGNMFQTIPIDVLSTSTFSVLFATHNPGGFPGSDTQAAILNLQLNSAGDLLIENSNSGVSADIRRVLAR